LKKAMLDTAGRTVAESSFPQKKTIAFTVVTVTYARDHGVNATIGRIKELIGTRQDIEFVLVDNNPDMVDRSWMLDGFANPVSVKIGKNKGVAARNDGAAAGRGSLILFVDDDTLIEPHDAFERFQTLFDADPDIGIVTSRAIMAATGETDRIIFPHTDKRKRADVAFKTFRFQGTGFVMRRSAYEAIGPMSDDIFYGLEEIDYAYRVIQAGYVILYEPGIRAIEYNDPGGRKPKREVEEMRLTNKMIISWKYMPSRYLALNIGLFTAYVVYLNRGRINPFRSAWRFVSWVRQNPGKRQPISRETEAYIRDCGGDVWK
jgi:GT2 family glycosyltransferase